MSMSGNLQPAIPDQFLLKYNPPVITIVYHFETNKQEKFYHEVLVEKRMLENMPNDDIVSHLYVSEDFYFNPKLVKR